MCSSDLGVALHFGVQSYALDRWLAASRDPNDTLRSYSESAFMNLRGKVLNQLEFLSDALPLPPAITAVALGGTSLFGGVATIIGTVVGVFIPAVLQNGFIIIGVNPYWQMIAVGVVLVIAVALDQWRRRAQNRR